MVELAAGMRVGKSLQLERLLGEGAMGSVWVAEHLALATRVAVKFIARDHREQKRHALLQRFEREAKAAAQIKSPHVVHIYDHGVMEDGTPYIVMELLEGETLGARLRRDGALGPGEVEQVVVQMCKALAKAHALGIVHRDIKPDNIFLTPSDEELFVKVLDFGIAKQVADPQEAVTATGAMLGTPLYMSPERITSSAATDPHADLWALAVVAYQALCGAPPFVGETVGALFFSICGDALVLPSQRRPELGSALDAWFGRALCQDVDKRHADARAMAKAFSAAVSKLPQAGAPRSARRAATGGGVQLDSAAMATAEFVSAHRLPTSPDGQAAAATEGAGEATASDLEAAETVALTPTSGEATAGAGDPTSGRAGTADEPGTDEAKRAAQAMTAQPATASTLGGAASSLGRAGARLGSTRARRALIGVALALAALGGWRLLGRDTTDTQGTAASASSEPAPPDGADVPLSVSCNDGCDSVQVDARIYRADEFAAAAAQHDQRAVAGELHIEVAPGRHRLRAEKVGYEPRAEDIDAQPGTPLSKHYQLKRKVGKIGKAVLREIVKRYEDLFAACYQASLVRDPSHRGTIQTRFVVQPDGTVERAEVVRGVGDPKLDRCMEQALEALRFPAPEGGGFVDVRYPFLVKPVRRTAAKATRSGRSARKKARRKRGSSNGKSTPPATPLPNAPPLNEPPAQQSMPQQQEIPQQRKW